MKQYSTAPDGSIDRHSDLVVKKTGRAFYATIRRREDLARVSARVSIEQAAELRDWLNKALEKYEQPGDGK